MTIRSLVATGMMSLAVAALIGCGDGKPSATRDTAPLAEPAATNVETPGLEPAKTGLLRIAVIPKGTTHVFWKAIHGGAVKAEKEADGVQIIWKGPIRICSDTPCPKAARPGWVANPGKTFSAMCATVLSAMYIESKRLSC